MKNHTKSYNYDKTKWHVIELYLNDYKQTEDEKQRTHILNELKCCADKGLHAKNWYQSEYTINKIKRLTEAHEDEQVMIKNLYHYLFKQDKNTHKRQSNHKDEAVEKRKRWIAVGMRS